MGKEMGLKNRYFSSKYDSVEQSKLWLCISSSVYIAYQNTNAFWKPRVSLSAAFNFFYKQSENAPGITVNLAQM